MRTHILVEDGNEIPDQRASPESRGQPSIDKDRRFGFLSGSWKRDAYIGVL